MDIGVGHYDPAPPEHLDPETLELLRAEDRLRFANHLKAWATVDGERIVDAGYSGTALIGATTVKLGPASLSVPAVSYPVIQLPPQLGETSVRFVQTAGGRTGAPLPRRIDRPPYLRLVAPAAWTTLSLTINIDGSTEFDVVGASPFPRHWIYDTTGNLVRKSGLIDFTEWTRVHDFDRTPWGDEERAALMSEVESQTERELSRVLMGQAKPSIRKLESGDTLIQQGSSGTEVYLVLDGMLDVKVDGELVAEVGPGAVIGERASLESGVRTSTVVATTAVTVAGVDASSLPRHTLVDVADLHRREEVT